MNSAVANISEQGAPLRLLAGSCRSGTTWLLDVLCEANQLRPVFEPVNGSAWRVAQPFSRRYVDAERAWPELESFWVSVLQHRGSSVWSNYRLLPANLMLRSGDLRSVAALKYRITRWTNLYHNFRRYRHLIKHNEVLVKAIRANLMVLWLAKTQHARVAFVIRHPASVVESQLRIGGIWNARRIAERYAEDDQLDLRLGMPWRQMVAQCNSDAALFTLIWWLENVVPYEDINGDRVGASRVAFVHYEKLLLRDEPEWERLLAGLELKTMPDDAILEAPSQQAAVPLGRKTISAQGMARGLERLSNHDRSEIQTTLERLKVDLYHVDAIMPRDRWAR